MHCLVYCANSYLSPLKRWLVLKYVYDKHVYFPPASETTNVKDFKLYFATAIILTSQQNHGSLLQAFSPPVFAQFDNCCALNMRPTGVYIKEFMLTSVFPRDIPSACWVLQKPGVTTHVQTSVLLADWNVLKNFCKNSWSGCASRWVENEFWPFFSFFAQRALFFFLSMKFRKKGFQKVLTLSLSNNHLKRF